MMDIARKCQSWNLNFEYVSSNLQLMLFLLGYFVFWVSRLYMQLEKHWAYHIVSYLVPFPRAGVLMKEMFCFIL
jgi:hypothetical protein